MVVVKPIEELGSRAAKCLKADSSGTVEAVFPSTVYLRARDGARACLVPSHVESGPLHAKVGDAWQGPASAVEVGHSWHLSANLLTVGTSGFCTRHASEWRPPEHPYPAMVTTDICTWLQGAPTHTLAHVITRPHNPLSAGDWRHRGSFELRRLKAWLNEPHSGSAPTGLIGLGPGLSPSGDDILGGLSLALRGRKDPRAHWLFDAVTPRLNETHPLSAAHLEAALDGEACEALHFVALSQASGSSVAKVILQRLAAVGSHSGWDMLLGAALLDLTEV